ncbi:MAG: hypothetical protein AAFY34_07725 [Pseudomonadota bacterium]
MTSTRLATVLAGMTALSTLALATPAEAETNITGAWSFRANVKIKGCVLTGNMTISQPADNGIRTCSFVSTEACEYAPGESWQMDQACRVTPQGDKYIIRSKVIRSLTPGYSLQNYLPDHFVVEPESSSLMTGIWQDANYAAPVEFWRDDSLPVS